MKSNKSNKSFTLIEMLGVVCIILILAGFIVSLVAASYDKVNRTKAYRQLSAIQNSLENFNAKNGFYPEGAADNYGKIGKTNSLGVCTQLFNSGYLMVDIRKYLTDLDETSFGRGNTNLSRIAGGMVVENSNTFSYYTDPWGSPWVYFCDFPNLKNYSLSCSHGIGASKQQ